MFISNNGFDILQKILSETAPRNLILNWGIVFFEAQSFEWYQYGRIWEVAERLQDSVNSI